MHSKNDLGKANNEISIYIYIYTYITNAIYEQIN